MKISITASVLILLVAALFGISNQQRLALVRQSHAQLVAEAAQLGISLDPSNPADPVRITKRERGNKIGGQARRRRVHRLRQGNGSLREKGWPAR